MSARIVAAAGTAGVGEAVAALPGLARPVVFQCGYGASGLPHLGTFGEVSYAVAPRVVDAVLSVAYRVFPDSKAAGGDTDKPSLGRGAQAMVKLLPGVHW